MALKPARNIVMEDINYFMFATGERGGVVCNASGFSGQGAATDDSDRRVAYAANPSGLAAVGVLMTDVVNVDLSRQKLNEFKNEVQIGDKVTIVRKGTVVTNFIAAGAASGAEHYPKTAYLGENGYLYDDSGYAASGWPVVGKFLTGVDGATNGYAEVLIDI